MQAAVSELSGCCAGVEYLKGSESFRSTALNDSRMNTCSFTWAVVAPLCSAVVTLSHLGSRAKGSLLSRTANNAKTKGGHLIDTALLMIKCVCSKRARTLPRG